MSSKIKLTLLLLLNFLLLETSAAGLCSGSEQEKNMLVLNQFCSGVATKDILYVSRDGLRVERGPVVTITKAPEWKVTVLNASSKIYYQSNYANYLAKLRTITLNISGELSDSTGWTKSKTLPLLNRLTNLWVKNATGKVEPMKIWTLADFQTNPNCTRLVAAGYGLPTPGGELPLQCEFFGAPKSILIPQRHYEGKGPAAAKQVWLATKELKKMPINDALFAIPKDYKRTDNLSRAMTTVDLKSDSFIIKDLLKNPDALFESR
jgi:hypothetical protein